MTAPTANLRTQRDQAAAWVYEGVWAALSRWLRVPRDPPSMPSDRGGRDTTRTFRPARAFLRYLKLWFWLIVAAAGAAGLVGLVALAVAGEAVGAVLLGVLLVVGVAVAVVAYVALHLRYDTTWYAMTDRSLRIRRGALVIREMTFTFENVQNVSVQQGPIQRLFGIASVLIETAGSGGDERRKGGAVSNRGVIEGVADAVAIRDAIAVHLRAARGSGLGDDAGVRATPVTAWRPEHLEALREIRAEIAQLR